MIKIERKQQQKAQAMPIERAETLVQPFKASEAISVSAEAQSPQKRQFKPFTAIDGTRNYRVYYRAACDFHERNNPPRLDDDNGAAYWERVCDDITETSNRYGNDPFLMAMLVAVFEELEREYKTLQGVID